mgnify:FL=1
MINWICGAICGSGATLLLYSILVGKRIQEEQDKACKCIFKYEEYRLKIRTLEYQKNELENEKKRLEYDLKSVQRR